MPASHSPPREDDDKEPRAPLLYRFRMPSRGEAVAPAVERIIEVVRPLGLDSDQLHDLAIALAEALSNAAVHGHHLEERRQVRVAVAVQPGERVGIEGRGSGGGVGSGSGSGPPAPAP